MFLFYSFVLQNVHLDCKQSIENDWSGVVYAGSGELFGILKFQDNESLQPDDAASRLLIRNVNSAWMKMAGNSSQKVYEVLVQKVENECVALKLSSQMCLDLELSGAGQILVDVQFQLNRKPLCEWHAAIDRLGPIQQSLLFPTPSAPQIEQEVYFISSYLKPSNVKNCFTIACLSRTIIVSFAVRYCSLHALHVQVH